MASTAPTMGPDESSSPPPPLPSLSCLAAAMFALAVVLEALFAELVGLAGVLSAVRDLLFLAVNLSWDVVTGEFVGDGADARVVDAPAGRTVSEAVSTAFNTAVVAAGFGVLEGGLSTGGVGVAILVPLMFKVDTALVVVAIGLVRVVAVVAVVVGVVVEDEGVGVLVLVVVMGVGLVVVVVVVVASKHVSDVWVVAGWILPCSHFQHVRSALTEPGFSIRWPTPHTRIGVQEPWSALGWN